MKSIAPFALATTLPAASVWAVTDPFLGSGIGRPAGPPGFDPPTVTSILRAFALVAIQLKKNAAQSACFAFAAIPYVSGADIAVWFPPALSVGIRKKPTLPATTLSRLPDSQSPSNMNTPPSCSNLLIIVG